MRVIGGEVVETQRHVAQPEEFLHFYQTARTLAFHSVLCSNLRNANSLCEAVLILFVTNFRLREDTGCDVSFVNAMHYLILH